ncbi:MAG: Hpt domain-containing protein, partial [Thiohalomonadales bacterium]
MSDSAIDTFVQEAHELLESMEQALLAMENDPEDESHINAIFRAAHTMKGTAGVFSFDFIEKFTHIVENVLDNVRLGELKIDTDLVALLLQAKDHMGVLVEDAAVLKQDPGDKTLLEDARLIEQFQRYLTEPEENNNQELDTTPTNSINENIDELESITADKPVTSENWHISLRFDPTLLQSGMDPSSFIRYLQKIGEIVSITTVFNKLPQYTELNPELCYLGFEIDFHSDESKEKIEEVFEFVRDLSTIHILPPQAKITDYVKLIESQDDESLKLGELLMSSGALTQRELDEALKVQSESEGKPPLGEKSKIGEVLVENRILQQEIVEVAVKKQVVSRNKLGSGARVL